MSKKKIAIITLACAMAITSAIPVLATVTGANPTKVDKPIKIQEKVTQLNEKAQKFGIDLTGLSLTDAKAKFQAAIQAKEQLRASKLGVDITGLSPANAKAKLQAAVQTKQQLRAGKLGVNITGFSPADAKVKLQEAAQAQKQARAEKQATKAQKQATKVQNI